jgi:hypothetical protein
MKITEPALVMSWSPPRLPFKLVDPCSILGLASTQGIKIIEEKVVPLYHGRIYWGGGVKPA